MSNVVQLGLPPLELEFPVSEKTMDSLVSRAEKIGFDNRIDFSILLTSPSGCTFTITSVTHGEMQTRKEVVPKRKASPCWRRMKIYFGRTIWKR